MTLRSPLFTPSFPAMRNQNPLCQKNKSSLPNTAFDSPEAIATSRLTSHIFFATGEDTLQESDQQHIKSLVYRLPRSARFTVYLHGYSDPRGTDEYNNVLSQERALTVQRSLVAEGIDRSRIISLGHGTQYSIAGIRDYDGYSRERRVDIEIHFEFPTKP